MPEPVLTPRQKAAVIVRLLLADGEQISLERLSPAAQASLAHEMALMNMVDRDTCNRVVEEFCETLERVGLTFPEGLERTLDILGGTISRDITDRLRRMAAMAGHSDPWERISAMPAQQLAELARTEATEIAAIMLSNMPVPKAAEIFSAIPPGRARQIAYAMSLTGGIEPAALRRIGMALLQAAEALTLPAMDGGPVEKVGAILNFTASGTRDEVLTGLEQDDSAFASEVRKTIFTWANIPRRIDARDIPRIVREADQADLIRAIAGARGDDAEAAEFILASLSSRMAESLREEVEGVGKVSAKECEDAMTNIVVTIRRMEEAGDLFLIANEAEDDIEDGAAAGISIQPAAAG